MGLNIQMIGALVGGTAIALLTTIGILMMEIRGLKGDLDERGRALTQCEVDLSGERIEIAQLEGEIEDQNARIAELKAAADAKAAELESEVERGREVLAEAEERIRRLRAARPADVQAAVEEVVEWVESL